MIYTLNEERGRRELICDDRFDLLNYDVTYFSPSSTAYSVSNKRKYVLSNDKKWIDIETGETLNGEEVSENYMEYITNNDWRNKQYLCNTEMDVFDIPLERDIIKPGSLAYVPATKATFILGPDYKWYNKKSGKEKEKPFKVLFRERMRYGMGGQHFKYQFEDGTVWDISESTGPFEVLGKTIYSDETVEITLISPGAGYYNLLMTTDDVDYDERGYWPEGTSVQSLSFSTGQTICLTVKDIVTDTKKISIACGGNPPM